MAEVGTRSEYTPSGWQKTSLDSSGIGKAGGWVRGQASRQVGGGIVSKSNKSAK